MRCSMVAFFMVAALGACTPSTRSQDPSDLAVSPGGVANCLTTQVPLSTFTNSGTGSDCAPTYGEARSSVVHVCSAFVACGAYDAVEYTQSYYELHCFYDHVSGTLVGAYDMSDGPPGCRVAGDGLSECANRTSSSCAADGGT
jgi:hypothetical protein